MCLNAECVTGAGRSWKSCWNGGSLVYTNAFTNLKGAFLCVTSIICFWVLCCVAVGAFSPAHLRWIIAETLLLFPNALEAGSLNCCLFGHFFQSFKSLLWKWGGKKKRKNLVRNKHSSRWQQGWLPAACSSGTRQRRCCWGDWSKLHDKRRVNNAWISRGSV